MANSKKIDKAPVTIGWREWMSLPELKIQQIKAKIDSGARTSSLHAFDVSTYKRHGKEFIKFSVHPIQKNQKLTSFCHAEVVDYRKVKSSNGQSEKRPVILTTLSMGEESWQGELTLTNRDQMGFRLLLGRQALKKKFLIDVSRSFLTSKKKNKRKK